MQVLGKFFEISVHYWKLVFSFLEQIYIKVSIVEQMFVSQNVFAETLMPQV